MKSFLKNKCKLLLFLLGAVGMFSCNKVVEVAPTAKVSLALAYADSTAAESDVNGIYFQLQQTGSIYNGTYCSQYPLLSDEASMGSSTSAANYELANNNIQTSNFLTSGLWSNNYATIYQANSVLENVGSVAMSEIRKNRYKGEARFARAYCYFILIQYFGSVPLAVSTDYQANSNLHKSDTGTIYPFIVSELLQAESLLPGGYDAYNGARVRASKEAAQALLARVYLYRKQWSNAETYAGKVINSGLFSFPAAYDDVVKANSTESILEMWASSSSFAFGNYTSANLVPFSATTTTKPSIVPGNSLVSSFETGDKRKTAYLSYSTYSASYYVNKYRDISSFTDQSKMLRLSEMYLIRAEARAMQNNINGAGSAEEDINKIRIRAGLPGTTATTQSAMVAVVLQERFIELLFEGHRWLDLKRTGLVKSVMAAAKPATWTDKTPVLFPIPAAEIGVNANLLPQNDGY